MTPTVSRIVTPIANRVNVKEFSSHLRTQRPPGSIGLRGMNRRRSPERSHRPSPGGRLSRSTVPQIQRSISQSPRWIRVSGLGRSTVPQIQRSISLCPLRFSVDLRPPPAHPYKKKTPILKKLRRLPLESMADELENPSHQEQTQPIQPQAMVENARYENGDRKQDCRNPKRVKRPVDGMLMTGTILRDPLLASASARHAQHHTTLAHSDLSGGIVTNLV